ncbi:MAG: HAMP domain-containing histidine kinase [Gorillibacterium sp.]|nr:HAMP domain-containing histidine kinase [Gorillibacterium sp.]
MLRNKDIKRMLLFMISISGGGTIAAFIIDPLAGTVVFITVLLLIGCALIFTFWRYREISKLSTDLRSISAGDYSLDIRDNQEGELSILKSNIYKVTLMLSEQSELLKRDKKYLADAISDISHQLKTPLTSMAVMTDLLLDNQLKEAKKNEFIRSIHTQLERIEWLVTSLLKLSKIDAGTIRFKKDRVMVTHLLDKATASLLIPIELREQTLSIRGDSEVSFIGDLNWTAEALINVLKNGIEHTGHGGAITIVYTENPLYTEIRVTDNGEGIETMDLPHIFKRFYKGKSSSEESVGIGLAMAKAILNNQNADITVKSERNIGTEFTIKFYKPIHSNVFSTR